VRACVRACGWVWVGGLVTLVAEQRSAGIGVMYMGVSKRAWCAWTQVQVWPAQEEGARALVSTS
jgi:hypothetical protein